MVFKAATPECSKMTNGDLHELARALHEHLSATGGFAIDEQTHRWLGEAQAVASDAVDPTVSEAVVKKRARQVGELLEQVDTTANESVNEHIAAARLIVEEITDL